MDFFWCFAAPLSLLSYDCLVSITVSVAAPSTNGWTGDLGVLYELRWLAAFGAIKSAGAPARLPLDILFIILRELVGYGVCMRVTP